jgi:hypothetical protein
MRSEYQAVEMFLLHMQPPLPTKWAGRSSCIPDYSRAECDQIRAHKRVKRAMDATKVLVPCFSVDCDRGIEVCTYWERDFDQANYLQFR